MNSDKTYKHTFTYTGTDDLGRSIGNLGDNDIPPYNSDKLVGIFYFINHGGKTSQGPYDISEILEKDPQAFRSNERWLSAGGGQVNTIHWWSESLFGYYRATDRWVKEKDIQMLTDAGVDFMILDTSNGATYKDQVLVLLDVLDEYYQQGYKVPKIAFVCKHTPGQHMMEIYKEIYLEHDEYSHLWFKLEGKPLILGKTEDSAFTKDFLDFFTIRYAQWPREPLREDGFPWMSFTFPQNVHGKSLGTSIISVSVAQHTGSLAFSTGAFYGDDSVRSRSYHNGKEDTSKDAYLYGLNFAEQFEYAISQDPDIIFITGWNEWIAYRLNSWYNVNEVTYEDVAIFVDAASANYSRDIQPMKGGFGDNYYMQLISYIRRFKGIGTTNIQEENLNKDLKYSSIDIKGSFSQWDNVGYTYLDYQDDIKERNHKGFGKLVYINETGRNDIIKSKVSFDNTNLYFYVETKEKLSSIEEPAWMNLLISTKQGDKSWYGYDFIVNRQINDNETYLEKSIGDWEWEKVSKLDYKIENNKLMLSIPLEDLKIENNIIDIQFKWADNYQVENGFWSFYIDGDSAPYGRLNYSFKNEEEK